MEPVKWGVIGTARIAMDRVIPAMQSTPDCEIVAIASRNDETARSAASSAGIERAYGSYQALLDDPGIDAVYLPLPNHLHLAWCLKALEAGKHVLCEKPITLDAAEASQLIAFRDRAHLVIEEAFAIRNHPQWDTLREVLNSGEIGSPISAQATLAYSNLDPADIRNRPEDGGGALYDIGSYAITASRLVFDAEPRRAIALIDRDARFGTDRLTSAILQFPHGHASFSVTTQGGPAAGGSHQHFGLVCSKGWLRAEFPFAHSTPAGCRLFVGDHKSTGTRPSREITLPAVNQYALQAERFSRLVRGEKARSFPLETALANMRVIDALFRSEQSGSWETV
ncbi:MAG: Gfo/Idh/MocA family oxidoreductase [Arenicellales bacterium]|jgi:predicted dehydrogenase|nr:NAD-binding protein [Acidiferrobacteraceae bacterium]MDP7221494.1 Gfo/Idh/MocA family oxidoreductase [Arenicellales bacterium]|tara:strand:- start:3552 stop:4568 length:1017 start_codon:yes stop_codon:yes gene_type:complete